MQYSLLFVSLCTMSRRSIHILISILVLIVLMAWWIFMYMHTESYKKKIDNLYHHNCGVAGCDDISHDALYHTEGIQWLSENISWSREQNTWSSNAAITTDSLQKKPKIYSLNKKSYTYGDKVEIRGENFRAFENDKIVILENLQGEKIYLSTDWNQRHSYISFTLPSRVCTVPEGESGISDCAERRGTMIDLKQGKYMLYYPDFGTNEYSNSVSFVIE